MCVGGGIGGGVCVGGEGCWGFVSGRGVVRSVGDSGRVGEV